METEAIKMEDLFWERFLDVVKEKPVVPIIGRDLLMVQYEGKEVSLYPLLAQLLAKTLGVSGEDLPEGEELHTIASRVMKTPGKSIQDVYTAIKILMPGEEKLSIPPALSKLAAIPNFQLFVTTTFDSLLERAINQERRLDGKARTQVISYIRNDVHDLPKPLKDLNYPVVFHLLGKLTSSEPSYAVTQEDILEFILALTSVQQSDALKNLFDALRDSNLLILGCSFGDWLARFFIRTAKCQRLSMGKPYFVADKRISSDNNLLIFLKDFSGDNTIICPGGGALEFIDELHRRWTERYPTGAPTPKPEETITNSSKRLGPVFLSYASEDRAVAVEIKEALEAVGVDVFFDKDDLHAGENWAIKLKRTINEASLFLALISKNTLPVPQTRYFRREWEQAAEEAKGRAETMIFIIPVIIDDTSLKATEPPQKFFAQQWQELPEGQPTQGFIEHIIKLYRKYQKMIAGAL